MTQHSSFSDFAFYLVRSRRRRRRLSGRRLKRLLAGGGARLGATFVAALGAGFGLAVLWKAIAARRVRPLAPPIDGEQATFAWRGHRVAYTRLGEGAPVILVHGIHAAAWSQEWRRVAADLARNHTVYVIDLLGFGRSDRPALRYTAALYVSLLDDFARRVVGEPAALVATSLSAAYAVALGARDAARFPALVLVAPTGLSRPVTPPPARTTLARDVVATPLVGHTVWNALASRTTLRRLLRASYADKTLVTDAVVDTAWQAAHQRGARHAPASFMCHLLDLDVREPFRRLTQPTLVLWGEKATTAPVDEIRPFMAARRDFTYVILDPAGDLPHDERPEEFTRLVTEFLDRSGHRPRRSKSEPRRVA
jgi:pimeloyl-ACP methyl ester carboxylesterase